jgi:predicted metal-binding membrane protein
MIHDRGAFAGVRYSVLGTSLVAWVFLVAGLGSGREALQALCGTTALPWLRLNWALSSALGWLVMLGAMMLPLTLPTLAHVWRSSLARRRRRALVLCLSAYLAAWLLSGLVIESLVMLLSSAWSTSSMALWMAVVAGVGVWQCSPLKQHCLNRCHSHRPLSAFGLRADVDVAMLGLAHGTWCVGSCWALMAAAALLPHAHTVGMVVVALVMYGERLDPPARPAWAFRGLPTAWGLVRREWHAYRAAAIALWTPALARVTVRRGG